MAINVEQADRELTEANEVFAKAFEAGDMDLLLTLYTDDCMIRADRYEPFIGHEGVKEHARRIRSERKVGKCIMLTDKFWESQILSPTAAIHSCSWRICDPEGNFQFNVLDMALWRRVDGVWKICRGMWTS